MISRHSRCMQSRRFGENDGSLSQVSRSCCAGLSDRKDRRMLDSRCEDV